MCMTCPRHSVIMKHSRCQAMFISSFCTEVPYVCVKLFTALLCIFIVHTHQLYPSELCRNPVYIHVCTCTFGMFFTDTKLCSVFLLFNSFSTCFSVDFALLPLFLCSVLQIATLDKFWSQNVSVYENSSIFCTMSSSMDHCEIHTAQTVTELCVYSNSLADETKKGSGDTTLELPLHALVK